MTSAGMPMSAMTMSPARVSPGGRTSGSFGAPSVTVVSASIDSPIGSTASADSPDGRSIDTTGIPDALTSAMTVSMRPDTGALRPVPKIASTMSEQSRTSEKCSSHAWLSPISTTVTPRRPRISRLIRASPRTSATRPIRNTDTLIAALQQRARDDESVAAVVAAAAEHRHLALEQLAVHGFHGGHDLAAGVLHQHERRDADLVDRPPIGLTHLCGVQDAHRALSKGFSATKNTKDTKGY